MVVTIILAVLNAIAAIPAIAKYFEEAMAAIVGWYVARQQAETLGMIADAAALAARAVTDEDRYQAAKAWQDALARGRISIN
jgi:hypothetical protein